MTHAHMALSKHPRVVPLSSVLPRLSSVPSQLFNVLPLFLGHDLALSERQSSTIDSAYHLGKIYLMYRVYQVHRGDQPLSPNWIISHAILVIVLTQGL